MHKNFRGCNNTNSVCSSDAYDADRYIHMEFTQQHTGVSIKDQVCMSTVK